MGECGCNNCHLEMEGAQGECGVSKKSGFRDRIKPSLESDRAPVSATLVSPTSGGRSHEVGKSSCDGGRCTAGSLVFDRSCLLAVESSGPVRSMAVAFVCMHACMNMGEGLERAAVVPLVTPGVSLTHSPWLSLAFMTFCFVYLSGCSDSLPLLHTTHQLS